MVGRWAHFAGRGRGHGPRRRRREVRHHSSVALALLLAACAAPARSDTVLLGMSFLRELEMNQSDGRLRLLQIP